MMTAAIRWLQCTPMMMRAETMATEMKGNVPAAWLMRHGSLCFVSDWRLALGVGIRFVKAKQEPAKNDMSGYA